MTENLEGVYKIGSEIAAKTPEISIEVLKLFSQQLPLDRLLTWLVLHALYQQHGDSVPVGAPEAALIGISTRAAHQHVRELADLGYVTKLDSYTVEVIPHGSIAES
jgi:DNA-binding MarR family transcriptional regulator